MNRIYLVSMSLLVVVGVMYIVATFGGTMKSVLGICMAGAGAAGVFGYIMSRRGKK
jgi:hypothetical protein